MSDPTVAKIVQKMYGDGEAETAKVDRVIVLLKTDGYYILRSIPTYLDDWIVGDLLLGGAVSVPIENIKAIELYGPDNLVAFQFRYDQLSKDPSAF
jgi:hypothetical protein